MGGRLGSSRYGPGGVVLAVTIRSRCGTWLIGLLTAVCPSVAAQGSSIAEPCTRGDATVPAGAREWCSQAAQAVVSAQPQLGILVAGGNPLLGAGRAGGGFRLGILPQASLTAKLNLVEIELPELRTRAATGAPAADRLRAVAPAISGTAMIGLLPGVSLAPMFGGIGSVDLLAQATYLPFQIFGTDGLEERAPDFAYGAGARIGIVRESFLLPGVAVSGMYRRMAQTGFGNVCRGTAKTASSESNQGYTFEQGACITSADSPQADGDAGELRFDLRNTSLRAIVSKRVALLGLAAGAGYDRWNSDVGFGFRAPGDPRYFRASDLELSSGRWSWFANGVLSLPFVALAIEAGWLDGGAALSGFDPARSRFDPGSGTWFGSLGVRLSL